MREAPSAQPEILDLNWLSDLLARDGFYLPFASTVSAALVLLLLQFVARKVDEQRKKLYAVAYVLDSSFRTLELTAVVLKHTVDPHIEATKRILEDDHELLEQLFLSGDFDILTDNNVRFEHLTTEFKVLLGHNDLELVQLAETLSYLSSNDRKERALNAFVNGHLRDIHVFGGLDGGRQQAILAAYWDHLVGIRTNMLRILAFIAHLIGPQYYRYSKSWRFVCFPHGEVQKAKVRLDQCLVEYADLIPNADFFAERKTQGIQRAL